MSTQQLIYETAVPVSAGRHSKVSVETGQDYGYCRHLNSVPLMAVEFPQAGNEYAIVFAQTDGQVVPLVVLGARRDQNLYLDADGRWQGTYLPAFVRRYPFVFSTSDEGKTFTLCVDEAYRGVNYLGRGQALFGSDGQPTDYVKGVLDFLQEYRLQFNRTQTFGERLHKLGLLEPMQAQFKLVSGEQVALSGFLAVDRARLKALPGEELAALAASDELELIYLHLASLRHFNGLRDKLAATSGAVPPATSDAAMPADGAATASTEDTPAEAPARAAAGAPATAAPA